MLGLDDTTAAAKSITKIHCKMNIVKDDIFQQVSSNNIHKTTTASSSNA
jgi:hypothetical protein